MNLNLNTENYNNCPVRVRQALTRAKKSGYRVTGVRASYHVGPRGVATAKVQSDG